MKRLGVIVLIGVLVVTVAVSCAPPGQPKAAATQAAGGATQDAAPAAAAQTEAAAGATKAKAATSSGGRVVADAKIVPVENANLSVPVSGIVKQVPVKEGDKVDTGLLLLKLDDAQQQVAVAQAKANLAKAQANLAQVQAGPREQEIAQAEATVAAAQADYQRLQDAAGPGSVAAAQAGLQQAQANLQHVLEGASEQTLIAAEADLKNAEAKLRNAQSAYNKVKTNSEIAMMPESLALEQATNAWEAARARLEDLQKGATSSQVAAARAAVGQAQAQLATAKDSLPDQLAAAKASVDRAQAQLDLLRAGTRPEAIEVAKADVAAATAAMQQALVSLSQTELRAPFPGTVAVVNTAVGQQVSPSNPPITLADTSKWEVETSDLTEFDVVGVKTGDQVTLTFDALPGVTIPGTVIRIRPIGEDNRGDTVYKVVVSPNQVDDRLLWNMSTVVEFAKK